MPNIQAIKKRMRSIEATQKITKAMKLVSLSKLQRYRDRKGHFDAYYNAVHGVAEQFVPFRDGDDEGARLFFIVMPDLGLCSAYVQSIMRTIRKTYRDGDVLYVLGTQNADALRNQGYALTHEPRSSEHIDLHHVVKDVNQYLNTYQIVALVPDYVNALTLECQTHVLKTKVEEQRDDVIYEPSYDRVVAMLLEQHLTALIRHAYFTSKVSEHTTRRIAMEKATDNAQDMLDNLGRKYNRERQEIITQEISEIVSGMEV